MVVKTPKIVVSQEGFLFPSSFLVYITLFWPNISPSSQCSPALLQSPPFAIMNKSRKDLLLMQNNIFQTVIHVFQELSQNITVSEIANKNPPSSCWMNSRAPNHWFLEEIHRPQGERQFLVDPRPTWCGKTVDSSWTPECYDLFSVRNQEALHMKEKKLKDSHFETWYLASCKGRTKTWMLFSDVLQFHHFGWYKFIHIQEIRAHASRKTPWREAAFFSPKKDERMKQKIKYTKPIQQSCKIRYTTVKN